MQFLAFPVLIYTLLFSVSSLGFVILNFLKLKNYNSLAPILGFSSIAIITYFLYFLLNLNVAIISLLSLVLFIITIIFSFIINKDEFLKLFKISFLLSLPVFLFFFCIVVFYGEQFYVFRGNHTDHFNYLRIALMLSDNNFSSIIDNRLNETFVTKQRPGAMLLLGLLFNIKFLDLFFVAYTYKIFLMILIVSSAYFFFYDNKIFYQKKNLFTVIIFVFSSWIIYIFEIDALSHLSSSFIYIVATGMLLNFVYNLEKKNYNFFIIYSIIISALFIIYPEIFLFYILQAFIFVMLNINFKLYFFYKNIKILSYVLFLFLLLTFPNYESTYYFVLKQIKYGFSNIPTTDLGYFGAFFLGRESAVLDDMAVNQVKIFLSTNPKLWSLFLKIFQINFETGYYFAPVNLIPSFFGYYFITIGKEINAFNILHAIILILFSIYLIFSLSRNLNILRKTNNNLSILLKSFIILFIFLLIVLIFKGKYWSIVRLYSYSPLFLYLFICFNFENRNEKLSLHPNYILLVLMVLFPLYKYGQYNSGIGTFDSFPSITHKEYKTDFNWKLDNKDFKGCKNILILQQPILDRHSIETAKYIFIKLKMDYKSHNYSRIDINSFSNNDSNVNFKDKDCKIIDNGNNYLIKKND